MVKSQDISTLVIQMVMKSTDQEFISYSASTIAYLLHTERSKLSREFKKKTGISLEEFLFKEKMNRAAFMLKTYKDITVKEVSERFGFCTPDYFIRKFKGYYGIRPGKYKEYKMYPNVFKNENRNRGLEAKAV